MSVCCIATGNPGGGVGRNSRLIRINRRSIELAAKKSPQSSFACMSCLKAGWCCRGALASAALLPPGDVAVGGRCDCADLECSDLDCGDLDCSDLDCSDLDCSDLAVGVAFGPTIA